MLTRSLLCGLLMAVASCAAAKPPLIIDADTANEIDDLYAILRLLRQNRFEVVALTSTQWFHYLAKDWIGPDLTTVEASQRINEQLLRLAGHADLPAPQGSREPIGKPWGGFEPKDSPAARAIVDHGRRASPDAKLTVVCLGATTNVASALGLDPSIAPNIRLYLLGLRYDHAAGVWNKSSFNVRRDLNAADLVLNTEALEVHVMPANIAQPLTFERADTFERLAPLGELGDYLADRWRAHAPEFEEWVMWDVALAVALVRPELAESVLVPTPPENTRRQVRVYRSIDARAMRDDFWQAVTPAP